MEIKATPEEIAALVVAIQEQRESDTINFPIEVMCQAVRKAIDGTETNDGASSIDRKGQ